MPWSAYAIGIGLLLLAIPAIGDFVALLIGGLALFVFALVFHKLQPSPTGGTTLAYWLLGAIGVAIAVCAAWLTVRIIQGNLTPRQHAASLNGLILVVGIPVLIGLAALRLIALGR